MTVQIENKTYHVTFGLNPIDGLHIQDIRTDNNFISFETIEAIFDEYEYQTYKQLERSMEGK